LENRNKLRNIAPSLSVLTLSAFQKLIYLMKNHPAEFKDSLKMHIQKYNLGQAHILA
jgi:hypothetical protein